MDLRYFAHKGQITLPTRIRQLIDSWEETPKEINTGLCADFASALWEQDRTLNITSDEDQDGLEYTHTFIEHQGRFYDAETPDGVDDWRQLPIYARQREELKEIKCPHTRRWLRQRLEAA